MIWPREVRNYLRKLCHFTIKHVIILKYALHISELNQRRFTGWKRCFRFRFCNGYLTETWISADGIVTGNTCIRHVSVSADTLKRIPYTRVSVRFTLAETLTAVMFPQLVNSEDTQLSVEFPEQWMRKLSLTGLLSAAFMFPQIPLSVDYSLDFLNVLTFLNHPVSNHMFILSGI